VSAPRRWIDDPNTDDGLRHVLQRAPQARSLDVGTRRRLGVRVARAAALPAVAVGWLFVKSAAAALAVVLGTGTVLVSTGVVDWSKPKPVVAPVLAPSRAPLAVAPVASPTPAPSVAADTADVAEPPVARAPVVVAPPAPSAAPDTSARSLSAEAALLEQARREMRRDAGMALSITDEHRARFPKGQLTSERLLIQIEALHRLHRDTEARALANRLLDGPSGGLYTERVRALLGDTQGH
jgi:hypothetical protein